jgi:hypothetical protein
MIAKVRRRATSAVERSLALVTLAGRMADA